MNIVRVAHNVPASTEKVSGLPIMRVNKEQQQKTLRQTQLEIKIHRLIEDEFKDLSTLEVMRSLNRVENRILEYVLRQETA